jgi:DNA gyrase subunit A
VLRGLAHIEEIGSSRHRIVITEIPFQLNKTTLIERIADLAGASWDITDLPDESIGGLGIIIELSACPTAQSAKSALQIYSLNRPLARRCWPWWMENRG